MSRIVLAASAVVLGLAGLAGSFAPQELLQSAGVPATVPATLVVQLGAAALIAFAIANWMAKDSRMGGIYNRPLAIGNLTHFTVGAFALIRPAAHGASAPLVAAAVVYALFALAFAKLAFAPPPLAESAA